MGRALLVGRLAARDMRRHLAQAVLLLVAIAAATTVLTLGLALNGVTSHPYQQTRAATKGPDAVAYMQNTARAGALITAKGVTGPSGPFPLITGGLHVMASRPGSTPKGAAQHRRRSTSRI